MLVCRVVIAMGMCICSVTKRDVIRLVMQIGKPEIIPLGIRFV